jgi:hypothetical protein
MLRMKFETSKEVGTRVPGVKSTSIESNVVDTSTDVRVQRVVADKVWSGGAEGWWSTSNTFGLEKLASDSTATVTIGL